VFFLLQIGPLRFKCFCFGGEMVTRQLEYVPRALLFLLTVLFHGALSQTLFSAKHYLPHADSVAALYAMSPVLASVSTASIDTFGRASRWEISYISFDTTSFWNSKLLTFQAKGDTIAFEKEALLGAGVWPLTDKWMDSDSAGTLSLGYGGRDILKGFPGCRMSATVLQLPFPPFAAAWDFMYYCPDSTRRIRLNATTGELLQTISWATDVNEPAGDDLPSGFTLRQNYPNPFNPSTTIRYGLPHRSQVSLVVYNTLGQFVSELVRGEQEAGYHEAKFNAWGLSSGVYFCRLQAGDFVQIRKLLLLR
jgi:hypothetical protein